jgi:hypothetical protein
LRRADLHIAPGGDKIISIHGQIEPGDRPSGRVASQGVFGAL